MNFDEHKASDHYLRSLFDKKSYKATTVVLYELSDSCQSKIKVLPCIFN